MYLPTRGYTFQHTPVFQNACYLSVSKRTYLLTRAVNSRLLSFPKETKNLEQIVLKTPSNCIKNFSMSVLNFLVLLFDVNCFNRTNLF